VEEDCEGAPKTRFPELIPSISAKKIEVLTRLFLALDLLRTLEKCIYDAREYDVFEYVYFDILIMFKGFILRYTRKDPPNN
jgi:hypothetical protein